MAFFFVVNFGAKGHKNSSTREGIFMMAFDGRLKLQARNFLDMFNNVAFAI